MNIKRPFILISNDDGYHANGIKTLVSFLKDHADVMFVHQKRLVRVSPVPFLLLLRCV